MTTTNTPERATARLIDRVAALDAIPGNWCDPMLTGQNAVLPKDQSYKPKEIERLLNAVRQRIEALPTVNTHDALQAENERLREVLGYIRDDRKVPAWLQTLARGALLNPQEPNNG